MDPDETISTVFACYQVQRAILRYLPLSDVKSLRFVDKQWKHFSLLGLKKKSLVVLDNPEVFQRYFEFLEETRFSVCFANYKIVFKPEVFSSASEVIIIFSKFWETCNSFVKELHIVFPWICGRSILRLVYGSEGGVPLEKIGLTIEDCGKDKWTGVEEEVSEGEEVHTYNGIFPNVISLQLNVLMVLTSEKKMFPFTWSQFFSKCPNICHLCIHSEFASSHFCKIVSALVEKRRILKSLKIGTRDQRLYSEEFLKKLVLLSGATTEVVSLGFLSSVRHDTSLDLILSRSCSTLRNLSFLQYRTTNQAKIQAFSSGGVDTFPNLTSLRITKDLLPNLNFLSRMVNLERLEIYRDSTIGQHDELSNPVISTRSLVIMGSVKSLVLEVSIPIDHVWKVVRWFPNVTRVQMKVNDVIARIIFMKWVELKELYLIAEITRDNNDIVRSTLTDEGITGISRDVLREVQISEDNSGDVDLGSMTRMPYIGNLKKLEMVKLQVIPDYQTGLTDYSVHFGLMELPKLSSVTLVKSLVSPVAAEMLRRKGIAVSL